MLVRQSRAVGLPYPAPDVFGLAVRVPTEDGRLGDLLFASTGLGRLTRFTLTAAVTPYGRPLSTLLPYRTPAGAVVLSAVFKDPRTVTLAWAVAVVRSGQERAARFGGLPLGPAAARARLPDRASVPPVLRRAEHSTGQPHNLGTDSREPPDPAGHSPATTKGP